MELQCQSKDVPVTSADDIFIRKAVEIVERHIDNLDLNVEILGRELGMSQTNLYRKLQGLVGFSANQFIRNIRLKKAAHILESRNYSLTEVAFMVGFRDAKYFSKIFKKHFGVLPKDYSKSDKSALPASAKNLISEL